MNTEIPDITHTADDTSLDENTKKRWSKPELLEFSTRKSEAKDVFNLTEGAPSSGPS